MGNNLFKRKSDSYWQPTAECSTDSSNVEIPYVFRRRRAFYQRKNLPEVQQCVQKVEKKRNRPVKRQPKPAKCPRKRKIVKLPKKTVLPPKVLPPNVLLPKVRICKVCSMKRNYEYKRKELKEESNKKNKNEGKTLVVLSPSAEKAVFRKSNQVSKHASVSRLRRYCHENSK